MCLAELQKKAGEFEETAEALKGSRTEQIRSLSRFRRGWLLELLEHVLELAQAMIAQP